MTTFTANDGAASNASSYARRWLLNGTSIGTGTTVVPSAAGSLVLEVTATGPGGSTVATSAAVTVSAASSLTLAVSGGTATTEGNSGTTNVPITAAVVRNGVTGALAYTWAITGISTNPANSSDFSAMSGSGTIGSGVSADTFNIAIVGDTTVEPNETYRVTVTLTASGVSNSTDGTITNDDSGTTPAPTVTNAATLTGTAGSTMTWTAPTFTGATGPITSGVEADGVPVITTTSGTGTFDSSAYAGKTLKAYGFGAASGGAIAASRSAGVAIQASGYAFTNSGLTNGPISGVPGFALLSGTTAGAITVQGGKLHMGNGLEFNAGGAVHPAGSSAAMLTLLYDANIVNHSNRTPLIIMAADKDNFVAIWDLETTGLNYGVVINGAWSAYNSVNFSMAVGDTLGVTGSDTTLTFYRKAAGTSSFTQVGSANVATASNYLPNKLGTGMGVGWFQNGTYNEGYYTEFDFPNFGISEVTAPAFVIASATERAPIKYANPTSVVRDLTITGTYAGVSGAMQYAIRNNATGAFIQDYTTALATLTGGVFSVTVNPAFSAGDANAGCTLIVRSATDTTKFAGFPLTLSSAADGVPLRMGMNLAGISNYSTQYPILDAMKSAGAVVPRGGTITLDSDGWPMSVPSGGDLYWAVPLDLTSRSYTLLYDGSAAVSPYDPNSNSKNAIGLPGNPDYSVAGKITFTASGSINVGISNIDSSNRIRNIRLVRTDRLALYTSGKVFNPDFLTKLGRFSSLRLMDWAGTNDSVIVNWADRTVPSNQNWGVMPIEMQVASANESYATSGSKLKQVWFCVPSKANDVYVTNFATYIRDNLNPNMKAAIEYSNEVWNSSFTAYNYANTQGQALNSGNPNPVQVWYGYRSAQIMNIFKTVFGASAFASRVAGVQATFGEWGNSDLANAQFAGIALANVGSIASLFKYWSPATYFGDGLGVYPGNEVDRPIVQGWANTYAANPIPANLNPVFEYLNHGTGLTANFSIDAKLALYALHAGIARTNGLECVAYEGGISWYYYAATDANKVNLTILFNAVLADSRMGDCYVSMTNETRKAGFTEVDAFNDIGAPGIFGPWPALASLYAADTPRWTIMSNVAALSS